ncbi:MAG: tetratricopeptide repeat protein [Candidatus Lokiarchaeota archaeon]|nr:tetratricopeptide repeat protein [Candidatus Lokiarchaeota archaeon]
MNMGNSFKQIDTDFNVIFSGKTFKDMILFSGRFANESIPEDEWKEVYGFLVGREIKENNQTTLYVEKLIPMVHGTRTEVYFGEQDYVISEPIMDKIYKAGLFICGWFHTHPGLNLFLSDTDIYNQLGFQSAYKHAIAAVFDFTKISENNNGLRVYRLNDINLGVASSYSEVLYEIESSASSPGNLIAKSLIDIADAYGHNQPLIKEAGELLKEKGSIDQLFEGMQAANVIQPSTANEATPKIQRNPEDELIQSNETKDFKSQVEILKNNYFEDEIDPYKSVDTSQRPPLFQDEVEEDSESPAGYYELLDNYSEQDFQVRALRNNIEAYKANNQPTGYLMIRLANRLIEMGNNMEALENLQTAESEFTANNDKLGIAVVKNELGLYYEDRGDYNNALNNFENALQILTEIGQNAKRIQVLNNIGNVYIKLNQHSQGFGYFKQAYELSLELRYPLGMVAALSNAVEVLLFLKNYRVAYSALVQNYNFFVQTRDNFGLGLTLTKFGHLYFTQGPQYYPLAEKYFRVALDTKFDNGYYKETVEDWLFLYEIYSHRNDLGAAEICLTQGLNITRTYEIGAEEGQFYEKFGELYLHKDKIEDSVQYYELALKNYQDFGDDENIAKIHEKLAALYLKFYQDKNRALEHFYGALNSYRIQNYSKMIAETLRKIADIQIELNDVESALECLYEAKSIYKVLYDDYSANLIDQKINSLKL